jgi:hypothetical protein
MRLYIDKDIVVTARLHPLKVADQLRVQLRGGMGRPRNHAPGDPVP